MIAVVGAGPTGLALAWLLHKEGRSVHLYEASDRAGGNVRSEWQDGYLLEFGPNSLRMDDPLHDFIQQVGLRSALVYAASAAKQRYVLTHGAYHKLPNGLLSFLLGGFFPWREKRRILRERKLRSQGPEQESVDAFFRRRFGDFVAENLVGALVSGIFAGDPRKLMVAAAFPQMAAAEQQYGSVIKGMFAGPKQQHRGVFSFVDGLQTLTDRLVEDLGSHFSPQNTLAAIRRQGQGWELDFGHRQVQADQVVLCLPAHALACIMQALDPQLAARLDAIHYPPVALVHRAYRRADIGHALDGFGALHVPGSEGFCLGTIFSSSVFPERNPAGTVLLTSMVGGAIHPERALLDEKTLLAGVGEDHRRYLGLRGAPLFERVTLYREAIPQYDAAVLGLEVEVQAWAQRGLFLGGNWLGGISVPNCIQNARRLCEQLKRPSE